MRDLTQTLQAIYDSEINVTITWLWDGGIDFTLHSYMDDEYQHVDKKGWHYVKTVAQLADALHLAAIAGFPMSGYARSGAERIPFLTGAATRRDARKTRCSIVQR
jgi:hypothetical protein